MEFQGLGLSLLGGVFPMALMLRVRIKLLVRGLIPSVPVPVVPLPGTSPSSVATLLGAAPSLGGGFGPGIVCLGTTLVPEY